MYMNIPSDVVKHKIMQKIMCHSSDVVFDICY
jgi:hypothetical protein